MTDNNWSQRILDALDQIRQQPPLIHHITNFVVMNSTANVTLAIGASPIMAHAHEEMDAIGGFSNALNLNIGTLTPYWIESMLLAGKAAAERNVPIVLDPVGSGATGLRTDAVKRLLDRLPVRVIRGNASEIMSLFSDDLKIRGVDSLENVEAVRSQAHQMAGRWGKTIAITGAVDFVSDGERAFEIHNGHPLFSRVTGTGCAATTAISCFCAVMDDGLAAATAALGYYGLCGELAARSAPGPGSFQVALIDALANATADEITGLLRIRPVSLA